MGIFMSGIHTASRNRHDSLNKNRGMPCKGFVGILYTLTSEYMAQIDGFLVKSGRGQVTRRSEYT
jgi:hypothetical protein